MPEKAQTTERTQPGRRAKAAAFVASLAFLVSAGESRPSIAEEEPVERQPKPTFVMGALEDSILSESPAYSVAVAEAIKGTEFNTVKVTMPWTYPRQCAEIDNDLDRFQNAVTATNESGLYFALNVIPGGGKGLGHAPTSPSQQRCYTDTLVSYMNAYEEKYAGGHLILELPNEPNSKTFWKPQHNSDGEWVAPKAVTRLLARAYPVLKEEAQKLNIGLTVVGGGLASNHRPQEFASEMGQEKKAPEFAGPMMNQFSLHPYGQVNNEPPDTMHPGGGTVGLADLQAFIKTLDESFVTKHTVLLSEYGAKTKVPAAQHGLYDVWPNGSPNLIDESTQSEYYTRAIKIARCEPRIGGLILFNMIDDKENGAGQGSWTSGLFYPDDGDLNTPLIRKSSHQGVQLEISAAKSDPNYCD